MSKTPSGTKHVRIKPYDPKRGHTTRKYTHGPTGKKFEESVGWYVVDDGLATYLGDLHQAASDPHSPAMFDVCTEKEAMVIQTREKKLREQRPADVEDPVDMTTRDLRKREPKPERTPVDERREARARRSIGGPKKAASPTT